MSRRERQIMKIVFEKECATVNEIRDLLPEPPTPMAVRRMLAILLEKGFLKSQKKGRENVYAAKQQKGAAGSKALREVLDTFFKGSIAQALATHLGRPGSQLTDDEAERLNALIEDLSDSNSTSQKGPKR